MRQSTNSNPLSLLWRIAKDLLWWGVPVALVLMFTVGFLPAIVFCLVVGIGYAAFRDRTGLL
jgi:hypothetical protein